jgi:hypothetical protein
MDLAQNLKKMWKIMVEGYSDGLSSPSTKQKEEPISKKQDNSSSTESSPNPLTQENQHITIVTSSADTSEKIIMERTTTETVPMIRDWSIGRIHELADGDIEAQFDAVAIAEEFDEWINIPPDQEELTYLSIEPEEWTQDQEIDTM